MSQKTDDLKGLKENVIIGKLIPAGTGLARYRNAEVEPDKEICGELYPSFGKEPQVEFDDATFGIFADQLGSVDLNDVQPGDEAFSADALNSVFAEGFPDAVSIDIFSDDDVAAADSADGSADGFSSDSASEEKTEEKTEE